MRPGGFGISRRIDIAVTLLPEPDSPTIATVSPAATSNETRSTAVTCPRSVRKRVVRSRTLSSGSGTQNPIFFFMAWSTQMRAWIGPGRSEPARSSPS